jgi:hypothetical protein
VSSVWRLPLALAVLAFLGWVGYEIARAGNDIATPRFATQSTLDHGKVSGRRIDGRSWSLDYDKATMSPDGSFATIAHVRDGRFHRDGKPDVLMRADDVTVNTITNDLTIRGPLQISEPIAPGHVRTVKTVGARYTGATRTLQLDHTATITDAGTTLTVATATVDFRTNDAKFGRIEGMRAGSSP